MKEHIEKKQLKKKHTEKKVKVVLYESGCGGGCMGGQTCYFLCGPQ